MNDIDIYKCLNNNNLIKQIKFLNKELTIEKLSSLWKYMLDSESNLNKYAMSKTEYLIDCLYRAKGGTKK